MRASHDIPDQISPMILSLSIQSSAIILKFSVKPDIMKIVLPGHFLHYNDSRTSIPSFKVNEY